jgi:hypothetical protein
MKLSLFHSQLLNNSTSLSKMPQKFDSSGWYVRHVEQVKQLFTDTFINPIKASYEEAEPTL